MTPSTTRASIDDLLGPSDTRYFGRGYQRVRHHLADVEVRCERITGTVSATAAVDYPADWSTKTTHPVAPHLSTVDAVIIAGQLAEAYLTHAHRLDPAARTRMWLRGFQMTAGSTASTRLAAIAVHGRRSGMRIGPWGSDMLISTFEFRLGTVRMSCEVQHDLGTVVVAPATWPDVEDLLGPATARHYGGGFAQRCHRIDEVVVDLIGQQAAAQVRIEDTVEPSQVGMAAGYEPALSLVDATVCMAQLAQVLAYQVEQVDRAETDTLWMRKFGMRCDTPNVSIADEIAMSGRVLRRRRIDRLHRSWRLYQMAGAIGGIQASASLAFNVPGAVADTSPADGGRR